MFSRLQTSSLVVSEVFAASRTYAVPDFQRPFAWTRTHVSRLFDDVAIAAGLDGEDPAEPDYFLGTVILMRGDDARSGVTSGQPARFDIVDGQQRFVTLTLILTALRDLESDPAFKAELDGLIHAHANPSATSAPPGEARFVPRLLLRPNDQAVFGQFVQASGVRIDAEAVEDLASPSHRALLSCRLAIDEQAVRLKPEERRRLAAFLLGHCHVVVIMAEDLDKAHKLFSVINETGIKLQRDQILKSEVMRATPAELTGQLHKIWEQTELRLGPKFEDLFSHIRSVHGLSRPQVIRAVRQIMSDLGGAVPFINKSLVPFADAYAKILDPDTATGVLPPPTVALLHQLRRLNGEDWVPAALLALQMALRDPEAGHRALLEVDRLAHLLRLMCLGGGRRQTRFNRVTAALRDGEGFSAARHPVFNVPREELRLIAHHLRDLYGRSPQACKLALMRVDDDLSGSVSPMMTSEVSVEHVLPQRPKASSDWRRVFQDGEERQVCTTSIGNLVLVTPRQNDRAKNAEFDAKKAIYATPEDGRGVLTITGQVIAEPVWDAARIRKREGEIVEAMMRIWQFELPGWPKQLGG